MAMAQTQTSAPAMAMALALALLAPARTPAPAPAQPRALAHAQPLAQPLVPALAPELALPLTPGGDCRCCCCYPVHPMKLPATNGRSVQRWSSLRKACFYNPFVIIIHYPPSAVRESLRPNDCGRRTPSSFWAAAPSEQARLAGVSSRMSPAKLVFEVVSFVIS